MFVGALPKRCCEQLLRIVDFDGWSSAYVGSSGSFRIERALRVARPGLPIFGNDVSLYSCALGSAMTGQDISCRFVGRLSFIEDRLAGAGQRARVAAVMVAEELCRYAADNPFAKRHFEHFQNDIDGLLEQALAKLDMLVETTKLTGFHAGDWRRHFDRAIEVGAGMICFPPTYKSGYERQYRFLTKNVEWTPPAYDVFDPESLADEVDRIEASGMPFCVFTDQRLDRPAAAEYTLARSKPIYAYASTRKSSVRHFQPVAAPFGYVPVDPSALTKNSVVSVVPATAKQIYFIRDVYLMKSIKPGSGGSFRYFVFVDGKLLGGLIYDLDRLPGASKSGKDVYLISDVATCREGRLSKLLALLATSETIIGDVECRLICRFEYVFTTAFSDHPVSMKYRGIYDLKHRKPNDDGKGFILNYESPVRRESAQHLYRQWFRKHASQRTG